MIKLTQEQIDYLQSMENEGRLRADAVLADARQPDSPLYPLIDWDMAKAAERYWLARAHDIVREVEVIITRRTLTISVPRYVKDPTVSGRTPGYVALTDLMQRPQEAREAMRAEITRALGFVQRAQRIGQAIGGYAEIAQAVELLCRARDGGIEVIAAAEAAG